MSPRGGVAEILLVEDNPADSRLTQEVLAERGLPSRLSVVPDGSAALAFLRRQVPYADAPRPDLILLDLNLPRRDGREVLAEIKGDPDLLRIPVVVLTTSGSPEDVSRCYDLRANCYITKPAGLDRFIDVLRQIEDFWLDVAVLPTTGEPSRDDPGGGWR